MDRKSFTLTPRWKFFYGNFTQTERALEKSFPFLILNLYDVECYLPNVGLGGFSFNSLKRIASLS